MFQCKDLLSLPTMSKAKLVAGENGLSNGIRWSYKAESMDFASWIHGQELLIVSSPVIHSKDFNLYQLVEEAIRLNLSGILLLVGPEYIQSVSKKIIRVANENKLPIICLPGNVPLVDIFEELGHAIAYKDKAALASQAKLLGYPIDKPQRIFMAHFTIPDNIKQLGMMSQIHTLFEEVFAKQNSPVIISCFNYNLIGLTGEASKETLKEIFNDFLKCLHLLEADIICKIGVGSSCEQNSMLRESFTEASKCLEMPEPVQWYEELGVLRLLMSMDDHKLLDEYMHQILGKLIEYDEKNGTQLVKTLKDYFHCNENMKDTAEYIFSHPNTIKYRLQKISGYSLSNSQDKLELQIALLLFYQS